MKSNSHIRQNFIPITVILLVLATIMTFCSLDFDILKEVKPFQVKLVNEYNLDKVGCLYNNMPYYNSYTKTNIRIKSFSGILKIRSDEKYHLLYSVTLGQYDGDKFIGVKYSESFEDRGNYSFDSRFIEGGFTTPTGHTGNIYFHSSIENRQDWSALYHTCFQDTEYPMILMMDSFNRDSEGVHYLEWIEIEE